MSGCRCVWWWGKRKLRRLWEGGRKAWRGRNDDDLLTVLEKGTFFFFFFLFYFLTALSGRQRSSKIVPAVCEGGFGGLVIDQSFLLIASTANRSAITDT